MIDGEKIDIAGQEYVIPPLNFTGLEKYLELNERLTQAPAMKEQLTIMAEMLVIALKRNYPDLTVEQAKDMLDLQNWPDICAAIANTSGLKKNQTQEMTSQ